MEIHRATARRRELGPQTRNPEEEVNLPGPRTPPSREFRLAARAGFLKKETNPPPPPYPGAAGKREPPPPEASSQATPKFRRQNRLPLPRPLGFPLRPRSSPANSVGARQCRVKTAFLLPGLFHLPAPSPVPPPEVTTAAGSCGCPVGLRGSGGKMAAAGALERSFVELSGAERERPRHFREFTVCGVGTGAAKEGAILFFRSGSSHGSLNL